MFEPVNHYIRLSLAVFSLELRKLLSYRFDFWINFIGSVFVEIAVAYFLWQAIFSYRGVDVIQGYSFAALIFYYLLVPITTNVMQGSVMHFISDEIYTGGLTRYLIYPLPFFLHKYVAHLAFGLVGLGQLALGIGLYALWFGIPQEVTLTPTHIVLGLISCLIGATLYFVLAACIEMIAFWADNVWSLMVLLKLGCRILGGALIPLAMFPEWSRSFLQYLPFYSYMAFPVETLMGRLSLAEWSLGAATACGWTFGACILGTWIWNCGRYRYQGVGI